MEPITVLIAEDHTLVREGTRQILEQEADLRVIGEAESGARAVELAGLLKPDVVLLDMRLPGLNGIEATKRIVDQFPAVRVLIVSAYDDEDYVLAALRAGAAGYLLKTAPGRELVAAIHTVCSGATVLQAAISRKLTQHWDHGPSRGANTSLTPREFEVLRLIAHGCSIKQIAGELGISLRTVEGHLNNLFGKLVVSSRTEAIRCAVQQHLISFDEGGET
jgi:DNA-binding NarL/FixJ family response regulator